MRLYHITSRSNLPNIMTNGLLINSGVEGIADRCWHKHYHQTYGMQPVFLTDSPVFLLGVMRTRVNDPVILEVDVDSDSVSPGQEFSGGEFICSKNIPADKIAIVSNLENLV